MIAIKEARRAGLLGRVHLGRDVLGGIVVGIVALPLAMAFAVASGVKPEQGIYTAIIAGVAVALFGGTRVQVAGPTGAFAVLLAGVVAEYGYPGLRIATILAGAILVAFGALRLGGVVKLIPESVILGFTAGIAFVIWIGQWPSFLGMAIPHGSVLASAGRVLSSLPRLHLTTTLVGVACVALIAAWRHAPRLRVVPGPLVALVGATLFVMLFRPDGVETVGSLFGGVPRGLPPVSLPTFDGPMVIELIRPAFSIALLGAIESLLSAAVADGMTGHRHDADQELIGQGIANLLAPLAGGFAATGAIARTATSIRHGGRSPVAALVHSAVLIVVLLLLAPLAAHIPMAALSAILFVVAYDMADLKRVYHTIRRAPRSDVAVMLLTLGLTVGADVIIAVEAGVALALIAFLRKMSAAVRVDSVSRQRDGVETPDGVVIYAIDGPFFFGAIERFERALAATNTEPETVIIDLERVPFIDLSGLIALRDAIDGFRRRHVHVVVCGANELVASKLGRSEIEGLGEIPVTATVTEVLSDLT